MIKGPKFKIARRLGAPIFEKTQTAKFKDKGINKSAKKPKAKSDYGLQLIEKQKARYTYGIADKQFSKYVKNIIAKKELEPAQKLFEELELRLDNVIYRLGIASTRAFARQLVSHGHIIVNGKKTNIPSYKSYVGDVISIREGSAKKTVFFEIDKKITEKELPSWLSYDEKKKEAKVQGKPVLQGQQLLFDLGAVMEFYKR